MEIERKFILTEVPEVVLKWGEEKLIESGYLTVSPQVRISRSTKMGVSTAKITVKKGFELSRPETEIDISLEKFEELRSNYIDVYPLIIKKQYVLKAYTLFPIFVNIVDAGLDTSFIYAEIEFPTEEIALACELPVWLKTATEVTGIKEYYMVNYWISTRLARLEMKEEFYFKELPLITTSPKKRYASQIAIMDETKIVRMKDMKIEGCEKFDTDIHIHCEKCGTDFGVPISVILDKMNEGSNKLEKGGKENG